MKSKKLSFKINRLIIILIFLSGFFIIDRTSWAKDDGIIIVEALYNPDGPDNKEYSYEWVRLKNLSEKELNIRNYEIRLGKFYKPFKFFENIPSESEILIYLGVGINENVDFKNGKRAIVYLGETSSKLGDSRGEMVLYGSSSHNVDTLIDYVLYGGENNTSSYCEQAVNKGIWIRGCFLEDVDEGVSLLVKDNKCKIAHVDIIDDEKDKYQKMIRINEILPSPKGSDDGEYIELYNFGKESVDLGAEKGWILEDRIGKKENNNYKKLYFNKYSGEKIIKSGNFLIIKEERDFNFALTEEDEIRLLDPGGFEVDKIEYNGAREGFSYGYHEKMNKWRWSEFLTPGSINEFKEAGEIEILVDKDFYKNIYANFEVNVSGIKEKNLKIKWEFGDGKSSYKPKTKHKYLKNGEYIVKLKVFNGEEDVKKDFDIKVEDFPEREVNILAINPNPKGEDVDGEWIELKNKSKKKVNLKNWSIATGASKKKLVNHPIYEDFIIKAGKIKQLTRELSKFSLNNKKGYIELRYPNGEVAYKLKYEKKEGVGDDEVYRKKEGGGWEWLKDKKNIINKVDGEMGENNEKDESVSLDLVEVKTISELDLIRDMNFEDIGKYSEIKKENLIKAPIQKEMRVILKKEENLLAQKQILGAWDNNFKKVREESGVFYFNPKGKEKRHYLVIFFKELFEHVL